MLHQVNDRQTQKCAYGTCMTGVTALYSYVICDVGTVNSIISKQHLLTCVKRRSGQKHACMMHIY